MDPVLKGAVTSVATAVVGSALGWAVTNHYLTQDQAASLTTYVVGSGSIALAGVLAWYAARQHTQTAMIQAINKADNGVKVVSENSTSPPAVSGPLK